MIAIVDAGPLYAAVDADDDDHQRCLAVLGRRDLDLVVPALVIAEVTYLVGRRLGARGT
jgi:predicted nucleic acid-binding protein